MRLSVTTVEAFRLWRDTGDWMALEDLEATIRRDAPPNEKMLRGRAFHSVIESPVKQEALGEHFYEAEGYRFGGPGMDRVLAMFPEGCVHEPKAEATVAGVTLVGKADALYGLGAWEAKLSDKIDVERYFDSFQWRAYIVLFGVKWVRYVLGQGDFSGNFVSVYTALPMTLYTYPKLGEDVRRLTSECAEFIVMRGLESHVQEREAA